MPLSGSYVAMITPFDEEGKLDEQAFENLVRQQLGSSTQGVVIGGTTGENMTLDFEEQLRLCGLAQQLFKEKKTIIAGAGVASTKEGVFKLQQLAKSGIDKALVVTPYYNKPCQKGLLAHYKQLAKVGIDLIIYHNPSRTGVHLQLPTMQKLSEEKNIIAIKESSGDMSLVQGIAKYTKLQILAGEDSLLLSYLVNGAQGSINVMGNLIPNEWAAIHRLFKEQLVSQALNLHLNYYELMQAIFKGGNPAGIKCAMHALGMVEASMRPPLYSPGKESKASIVQALKQLSLLPELSPPD